MNESPDRIDDTSTPVEAGVEVQPRWMRVSLIVVGLGVLALVVVLSRL